jgi:hypothetical protein
MSRSSLKYNELQSSGHSSNTSTPGANILRVMTFNTFRMGERVENGIAKIVKHIRTSNAHVILLQVILNSFTS